ncbi:proteinase-activated receptor 3 [Boleophthalmus pectinirostris]|uniref:proteinase-activated receptor 3 n=1 Tax=Boleophthalmus pectinirostris TaxID=150288 RepID=UPI000A1C3B88|nr:proteinase-activated receptor 3 [Boleophthalmus pectinirostris]
MANLMQGLVLCLMAAQSLQHTGDTKASIGNSSNKGQRTFKPRNYTLTHINQSWPGMDPFLHVGPEEPATAFTTGILSNWIIPSAYVLSMLLGIPSNAYILAFLRVKIKDKSRATIILYLNLALSDLLLLLSLALRIHYHINKNHWIFGEVSCRLVTALFYGNVYCSSQTIACISMKRYLAVVKPFLYRRMATTSLSLWACLIVWLLFGAAIVPELLVRQSYFISELGVVTCHDILPLDVEPHSLLVPFRLGLVCLGFIVPFFVCIYVHVSVVYHLGQSGCDWKPYIKISSLVFVIFVVCFLPSGILHIIHYICLIVNGDDHMYTYYRAAVCLCCFHSCLDPLLCLLLSRTASSELHFTSLRGTPLTTSAVM